MQIENGEQEAKIFELTSRLIDLMAKLTQREREKTIQVLVESLDKLESSQPAQIEVEKQIVHKTQKSGLKPNKNVKGLSIEEQKQIIAKLIEEEVKTPKFTFPTRFFKCVYCDVKFAKKERMDVHIASCHPNSLFEC